MLPTKQKYIDLILFMNLIYNILNKPMGYMDIYDEAGKVDPNSESPVILALFKLEDAKLIEYSNVSQLYSRIKDE